MNYDDRYQRPVAGPPGVSGNVRLDMGDLSSNFESGDGVMTRFTVQAVGTGVTRIDLQDGANNKTAPELIAADIQPYDVVTSNATLVVGNARCPSQTPEPFPISDPSAKCTWAHSSARALHAEFGAVNDPLEPGCGGHCDSYR